MITVAFRRPFIVAQKVKRKKLTLRLGYMVGGESETESDKTELGWAFKGNGHSPVAVDSCNDSFVPLILCSLVVVHIAL